MLVIGVDVGGTFTDVVCSDGTKTWKAKSPTIPDNFSTGVLGGCTLIAEQLGTSLEDMLTKVERFGLGTTAVTNVLATKQGLRVGLLTTAGFENHLHISRGARVNVDGWLEPPWNPVDRTSVAGIDERIDRQGQIIKALDEQAVTTAVTKLREESGIEALAISFLWSCRNPKHEQQAAAIARSIAPGMPVFTGSELHPILREYERTTMAVINAFSAEALDGVESLEKELADLGLKVPLLLLHSGGGAVSVGEARKNPLGLASSGPAAGAVAAGEVAQSINTPEAMTVDIGGTSVDVAVIRDGVPERRQQAVINGLVTGISSVDVESIGTGGGSMAWIDSRNALRVGPRSARAIPGPVCYGRGGEIPTITDANLVLGYISADSFKSGGIVLDTDAALKSCEKMGAPLGLNGIETAYGIREIGLAQMEKAIRARLSSGGHDPRKFSLFACGGSGSLLVPSVAQHMGFKSVIASELSSVLSAYGAAAANIRYESVKAVDQVYPLTDNFEPLLQALQAEVDQQLAASHVPEDKREFIYEADLRIYRQRTNMTLPLTNGVGDLPGLEEVFKQNYAEKYGAGASSAATQIELSTLRVIGIGRTVRASMQTDTEVAGVGSKPQASGSRDVWVERDQKVDVPVYLLDQLHQGHKVVGPALIDASDTTVWVPVGMATRLEANRTLVTRAEK